ncbi:MAG: hypothetical protein ACFE8B_04260 [Candidatus Hermodarchaeota archaeon]
MNTKGMAFIDIRNAHISLFGEERWNKFFQEFKNRYNQFPNSPLVTTPIHIDLFLPFIDELTKEYYNGNQRVYWGFGETAAQTSLSEGGHLNVFIRSKKNPRSFINYALARIWQNYFDMGREEFELEGDLLHARLLDLPRYHPYIEFTTMGYIKKTLEIVGVEVKEIKKIKSSAKETYYQFLLEF